MYRVIPILIYHFVHGIDAVSLSAEGEVRNVIDNIRDDVGPFQVGARGSNVVFTDPIHHKIFQYYPTSNVIEQFAGNGQSGSVDGPCS